MPQDRHTVPSMLQHTWAASYLPTSCCTEGGKQGVAQLITYRHNAGTEHTQASPALSTPITVLSLITLSAGQITQNIKRMVERKLLEMNP